MTLVWQRITLVMAVAISWASASGHPLEAADSEGSEPLLLRCLVSLVEEAKVPAREGGVLVEVFIREGDSVSKEERIARIDDSQPQAEKRKATAEHDQAIAKAQSDVDVRYAEAAEKVAEAESKKALDSHGKVPGSVTEVERDRLSLNEKKAELQIEQAQLERQISKLTADAKEAEVGAVENAWWCRSFHTKGNGCSRAIRWHALCASTRCASKATSILPAGIPMLCGIGR